MENISTRNIAFISNGCLYYVDLETGKRKEIVCEFGEKMKDRMIRSYQNKEWRLRSNQQNLFSSGYSLWSGSQLQNPAYGMRSIISGAAFEPKERSFFFAFEGEESAGLFSVDVSNFHEKRLFHSPHYVIRNVALSPSGKKIVYSCISQTASENLFILDKETNQKTEITEGESIDTAPSWSGDEQHILFQSAGIGRNAAGVEVSLGPFEILELDLTNNQMTNILSIDGKDLYLPRYSPDGSKIFMIAKPYEAIESPSFVKTLLNIIMIPFRLLKALFEFINFFVAKYAGKPLLETNQFRRKFDLQQALLQGFGPLWDYDASIDEIEEEAEKIRAPKSWKLIEYDLASGKWRPLIDGVSTFDIAEDNTILFSDGRDILRALPDGSNREKIYAASFVRNVLWC